MPEYVKFVGAVAYNIIEALVNVKSRKYYVDV